MRLALEKRIVDLEARAGALKTGRTEDQQRTAERYFKLLLQGRAIPRRLQEQMARVPPVVEWHPALSKMMEPYLGVAGVEKLERSWRERQRGGET